MPRRKSAPRLYFDRARRNWVIRDGTAYIRTGCAESDTGGAERALAHYIGRKYRPVASATPSILDILLAYSQEHVPHQRSAKKIAHTVENLQRWWGDKRLSDVSARTCRAYAAERPPVAARRDLETLRAAIRYWHKEYGPLPSIPFVVLPDKPAPRERWLTRSEAARLLWAARRVEHLRRFILLGLHTGSRAGAILGARWDWVDLETGLMRRRAPGTVETTKRTPPVRLQAGMLGHVRRWAKRDGAEQRGNHQKDMMHQSFEAVLSSEGNHPPHGEPDGFICHYVGKRVTKLRRSWLGAVRRAELKGKVTPHTLRHTRATWLLRDGVSIWDASQELGMSALVISTVYGHHASGYQERRK